MKLIILDRDGVINFDSPDYIKSPDEWHPIPGSLEAVARLKQAGFSIAVATNQSGISRKLYDEEILKAIHHKMNSALETLGGNIDKIVHCPHLPTDGCVCRKPNTGMLLDIANHFSCSLENVPFVGDRVTDVIAAKAVSAKPILVETAYADLDLSHDAVKNVPIYENLTAVVNALIK